MASDLCVDVQVANMTNIAAVPEGLTSAGGRNIWKDGSGHRHIFASFGDPWSAVYLNTNTGLSYLISGSPAGSGHRSPCYDPVSNKLYGLCEYEFTNGSIWMFDPVTQTLTTLLAGINCAVNYPVRGDDNRIYFSVLGCHFYSYDPVTEEVKDYGVPDDGAGLNLYATTLQMMVDTTHFYVACKVSGVDQHKIFQTPISGPVTWTEWPNGLCYGYYLNTWKTPSPNLFWCLKQVLVDSSIKYWKPVSGVWTEYGSDPGQEQYLTLKTPFTYNGDWLDLWPSRIGYEANFDDLIPLKDLTEVSKFNWRVAEGEWQTTSEHPYTGIWEQQITQDMVPLSGTEMFCTTYGYGPVYKLDYDVPSLTYLGPQCFSPYYAMKHSSGEIYICGYAGLVTRYDPTKEYTLTTGQMTPRYPDPLNPNPYSIYKLRPDGEVLHYWHKMDYDANDLVWIGGNTTRKTVDWGDVFWYDPDDGSYGYMFPSWKDATQFRYLCAANNRSLICVSDSVGNIWIINTAAKTVDPVPIRPTVEDSKTYMIELSTNLVFGIVYVGSSYKVITFNPSTKVVQSLQDLTISGVPFGFPYNHYSRMDYHIILGPEGTPWLFIGNSLFEYNIASSSFSKVGDFSYGKLKVAANGTDVIAYRNGVVISKLSLSSAQRCHYWRGQPAMDLSLAKL